jgi:hypothetical protein
LGSKSGHNRRSVLVSSPIRGRRPEFCCCQTIAVLSMWGALSDESTGLSFITAAGPRQRSHSRVLIPLQCQNQSQSYFITGGLPPVNSSRRQPLETQGQQFFSTEPLQSQSLRNILSDERIGLSFTTAAGPRQRNNSQVRVSPDS